jgi:hypothetical protein
LDSSEDDGNEVGGDGRMDLIGWANFSVSIH